MTFRVFIIFALPVFFLAPPVGWASVAAGDTGKRLGLLAKLGADSPLASGEAGEGPGLDSLLESNASSLFGGKASFKDGRVTIRYVAKGLFNQDFRAKTGKGVTGVFSDPKDIKNALVKADLTKEVSGFSFVGLGAGRATSNFALSGDLKLSFKLRVPNLTPAAKLIVRWHQKGSKGYIQTSFFQKIVAVHKGRKRRAAAKDSRFTGAPTSWFDVKSKGVPVEISFKGQRAAVSVGRGEGENSEKVEVVSLGGIEAPSSGRLSFRFANISFLITDLAIEGNYDRSWAEAVIEELRREGKLKRPIPDAVAKKEKGNAGIDHSDPEADEEL